MSRVAPSASPGTSLMLTDLTKRYAGAAVVDGIDLNVEPGEFITFLGPSGSGKTTTLNMIAGFVNPDGGTIEVGGREISHTPPHKRGIGVVFQSYALFPHMTVRENIAYPLQQRRPRPDRRELTQLVDEAMRMVELVDYARRKPGELSGGQQQRVALARALVFHPKLLLLDEPLGALDKRLRESLQLELRRIHRELGVTVVFVTHDQEEALALSDRIVVFNQGRIEQVGTPAEIYKNPRSVFVARFLGESNIFEGSIRNGVLTGSETMHVDQADDAQDCSVLVRPENVRLVPLAAPSNERNRIEATVTDVTYAGASRRVALDSAGGSAIVVRDHRFDTPVSIGERLAVTFAAQSCRVISERELTR